MVKRSPAAQQQTLSARDLALLRIQARVRARGTNVADILAAIARIRARVNSVEGELTEAEIDRAIEEETAVGNDDDSIDFYEDFGPDPGNATFIQPRAPGSRTALQIEGDEAFERIKARVEARLKALQNLSVEVRPSVSRN